MDKIYSRRRLTIFKVHKKVLVLIILALAILVLYHVLASADEVFDSICSSKANSIAVDTIAAASTGVLSNITYGDLVMVDKDASGNIIMVSTNTITINNLRGEIVGNVQKGLNDLDKTSINIPAGSLLGNRVFAGFGPNIPIKIVPFGNVDANFRSEFEAARC